MLLLLHSNPVWDPIMRQKRGLYWVAHKWFFRAPQKIKYYLLILYFCIFSHLILSIYAEYVEYFVSKKCFQSASIYVTQQEENTQCQLGGIIIQQSSVCGVAWPGIKLRLSFCEPGLRRPPSSPAACGEGLVLWSRSEFYCGVREIF